MSNNKRVATTIRSRDAGVSRSALSRMCKDGRVQRVARGLYLFPEAELTEHHGLVEASQLVPRGIICLLSALNFHNLTTQSPFEVWMAINAKARKPKISYPPLHIVRFSGNALSYGVQEHHVEGQPVKITTPAKTVADCFKYRNKLGKDVAVEALRHFLRQGHSVGELWEACKVCRVSRVIQRYLEALT